jgi:DNA repair exonuclease SbcCD ATPase subunit
VRTTIIVLTTPFILFLAATGCGRKEDHRARLAKLQEEHRKDIARLESTYTSRIEGYKQQLAAQEKDLLAKSSELAEAKRLLAEQRTQSAAVDLKQDQKAKAAAVMPGVSKDGASESAQPESPPISKNLSLLEQFILEYESGLDKNRKESYLKEFGSFLAKLRSQAQNEPALRRKEKTLAELREKIEVETDGNEREELEKRMESIQNASEEDLEGVLDYYQQLDNNADLSRLMEEYGISRDELRDYGITPPPRTRWGPEAKEIATNLNAFVEDYAPLVPEEQREQYRQDFNEIISNLSTIPTDAQVLQRKNQMLADLQAQYATADEGDKEHIQHRIERLESRDLDSLRRRVQMQNTREIRNIAEKYGISRSELYQSGVTISRSRRSR